MLGLSDHVRSFVNPAWTSSFSGNDLNTTSPTVKQSDISHEKVQGLSRSFPPAIHLEHHPCENFSFSPPPIDRKRTGPRRKFLTSPIQSYKKVLNLIILFSTCVACPVCYVPVDQALALMPAAPTTSPILQTLNYLSEDNLVLNESNSGSLFGGYPSLEQRDMSFDIKDSMTVHCGYVLV